MDQPPVPQPVGLEACDATGSVICNTKTSGKGISWSEEKNVALAKAASVVYTDPVVGAGMKSKDMNKKIRSLSINDALKPEFACTSRDKGPLDSRRWDGRSFVACGKQWEVLRRECTKFKGCMDRIQRMKLTGNPTEEDVHRCASLLYSDGSQSASHVYDCVRTPSYHISKPFKFDTTYKFLSKHKTMIEAGGIDGDEPKKFARPIGTKAAKNVKEKKRVSGDSSEKKEMGSSLQCLEKLLADNAAYR